MDEPGIEFRFGLKKRIYNWNMRLARELRGWTQRDLAGAVDIGKQTIGQIETLRAFPIPERAEKIAEALGTTSETLFPQWLKDFKLKRVPTSTQNESISLEEAIEHHLIGPKELMESGFEDSVIEKIDNEMLRDKIHSVLAGLDPKEQKVISLRFGLDGGRSRTCEEVGVHFNVTRERIRQIESKALRKLRYPQRSSQLEIFL